MRLAKLAQVTIEFISEVRVGFLSYQIQRIQRNKQITAMLIYASISINLYVRMLFLICKRRGDYDGLPEPKPPAAVVVTEKEAVSPATRIAVKKPSGGEVEVK